MKKQIFLALALCVSCAAWAQTDLTAPTALPGSHSQATCESPSSLRGRMLVCDYSDCTVSYRALDAEMNHTPWSAEVPLREYPVGQYPVGSDGALYVSKIYDPAASIGSDVIKYVKTGASTAKLRIFCTPAGHRAPEVMAVLARLEELPEEEVSRLVTAYLGGDSYEGVELEFTSPATAIATVKCGHAGGCDAILKGVKITLVPSAAVQQKHDEIMHCFNRVRDIAASDATEHLYRKRLMSMLPHLAKGVYINYTSSQTKGNTALHYACGLGDVELVSVLLKWGADIHARTNKGATPLQCASSQTIRKLLMKYGAE